MRLCRGSNRQVADFQGKNVRATYLLLVSGKNRVNEKAVGERFGEPILRPDADFVREATGFAIGGIPPLGHATLIATYVDEDLMQYEKVFAAAGTPSAIFAVDPAALREAVSGHLIKVT